MEKLNFRLREIPDSGLDLVVELPADMLATALEGVEVVDPAQSSARVVAEVTKVGDNVFVHGQLLGEAQVSCSRCLEPARIDLTTPLKLTLMPDEAGAPDPDADSLATSDDEFATYQGDKIELADLVREQIVLAVPIAPLCQDSCRGLCPTCGVNRNLTRCQCAPAEVVDEHAFAQLKSLKIP